MGNNIDLIWLLGLPRCLICKKCNKETETYFDDYDIDCGEPQAKKGIMHFDVICNNCEEAFQYSIRINYEDD